MATPQRCVHTIGYDADAVLFGGDFNDIQSSKMYHQLTGNLNDAWVVSGRDEGFTISADQPSKRIDYIFYSGELQSAATWGPETEASDHRPVVSEFILVDDE